MKRSLGAIAFILLCISASDSISAAAPAEPKTPLRSIRLDATGSIKAKPDMAQITLGVVSEGDSARVALDQNNAATARVIDMLKQNDVAPEDIQTIDFSVRPRYEPTKPSDNKPPVINGYRVVNSIRIVVRDLNKLGEILDKAVTQGSNEIGGIMFDVADPSKLLDEARKRAMEIATAKAKLYADEAGATLGRVLTIDEQNAVPWRPRSFAARMDSKSAEVPLQSGEAELQVQISVMWELEDQKSTPQ